MFKNLIKQNQLAFIILTILFLIDRSSKFFILKLVEQGEKLDIYITSYLNLYLIWNKGIAFGLLSFNENIIYNTITVLILIIIFTILIMVIKSKGFVKYSLVVVLAGALGNVFDRIYYSAVPDFIDFHINEFHWFIFNIADIFVTIGVFCLIYVELFINKEIKNNEKNY
ncbi:signal peptidase II [Candidatus Pelagibacter sp.]|nr:signal peptidase II [Candidatus Pelagibacter sp.]MDC1246193.1 signal peptidase II [Pelagibacteraceae bacterium]|tara:strand:- start:717 stop:1223 length:507 start_codon:yes stop_codon:yes gene_type:complete